MTPEWKSPYYEGKKSTWFGYVKDVLALAAIVGMLYVSVYLVAAAI